MSNDFATNKYKMYRDSGEKIKKFFKSNSFQDNEREKLEDPKSLSFALSEIQNNPEWKKQLSQNNLFTNWVEVVGKEIAEHSAPISLFEGLLSIQTSSTAWSVQLNLMKEELLKTIQKSEAGVLVEELKITPPRSKSWKKGLLSTRDAKGVRDTYI